MRPSPPRAREPLARVERLKQSARLCDCGRVAAYRVTVTQLSAETRRRAVNLILCAVCYGEWMAVEGNEQRARGGLDTSALDDGPGPCYGPCMDNYPLSTDPVRPLPKRVDDMLAAIRDYLLRHAPEEGVKLTIHVSPKRGAFRLELPPEVKRF